MSHRWLWLISPTLWLGLMLVRAIDRRAWGAAAGWGAALAAWQLALLSSLAVLRNPNR